jgi:hypothetical protein
MTNTQKLIRFEAKTYYASQIEAMYKEDELKVWLFHPWTQQIDISIIIKQILECW